MTRLALALSRLSTHRPWLTLATWAVLTVVLVLGAGALGRAYSDDLDIPGSDSAAAAALLDGSADGAGSRVLIAAPEPLSSPDAITHADALLAEIAGLLEVETPAPLTDPAAATAAGQLSADALALNVPLDVDVDAIAEPTLANLIEVVEAESELGWEVAFAGELARTLDQNHSRASEAIGLAVAVIALTVALGSIAAMTVPVIAGVIAVMSGISLLGLLSHAVSIPEVAPTLATMIGLGIGIDYALFQVVRMRALLARGVDRSTAVAQTSTSAGAASAFAGVTVAVAICALALSGVSFIGWLGYASAIVAIVVVLNTLTMTPALLAVLAPRLRPSTARAERSGAGMARAAEAVVRKPVLSAIAAFAVLGVVAVPALSLELGMSGPGERPAGTQLRTSYDLRAEHFGEGSNGSLVIAVELDSPAETAQDPRLAEVSADIARLDAAAATPLVPLAAGSTVASAQVTPREDANAASTAELVDALRALDTPDGTSLHVGGATAARIDLEERVAERLPWVVVAVVLASTIVLTVAFRSVLVPLKAALLNLVSVAASYGVVVAVFQWGWGASLLGLDGPVPIDAFVPMILFTVLFGLSTDYEVFLVTGMREHWERTGDARGAIVEGIRSSGRVVTTAAIIMIAVFLGFVIDPDPTVKIFGVGLAASILIDATIIRMVLVPALMALLGRRAWWVPRGLARVLPAPHGSGADAGEAPAEPSPVAMGGRP